VGVGAFGEVWKGLYEGRPVAIKCFRAQPPTGVGGGAANGAKAAAAALKSCGGALLAATAEMVAGEIRLMERVGGKPHVLPLEGVFVSRATREVALVLPFMAHGSLHDLLLDAQSPSYRPSVSMNALVRFALQAADGVRGLHEEAVIHRDLACRNLLVNAGTYVCVCGLVRLM
jgi:serine/threonine protein kinase